MSLLNVSEILNKLGIENSNAGTWIGSQSLSNNNTITSTSPVDAKTIGTVSVTTPEEYDKVVTTANEAQAAWQKFTAPQRGEIVRQYGNILREYKQELGALVSYEMGKSFQEGLGEVQEMIDICDFAVGLSRQLYGLTMHSERPNHRMYEQWHPLGVVGIISAFNFPVAVWSWNTALAWVCGNTTIWKPSEKTPLTAVACQKLFNEVAQANDLPDGISCIINGDYQVGELMTQDKRVPLISATGSTRMGRTVGQTVAARFGKTILELGGNNALIVTKHAQMKTAILATVFGATGTCGQRCTSTRRLLVNEDLIDSFTQSLQQAYSKLSIGNPLDSKNHVGPLIDEDAVKLYLETLDKLNAAGAEAIVPGGQITEGVDSNCYVKPCIYRVDKNHEITHTEVFAPVLYVMPFSTLEEAIEIQNGVPQGLSSAIFSDNLKETEYFLSHVGSDCGIANVNIGTSGAEIGGAFGGEKETGGGRESGSDAWKGYMRRQTNTINYSDDLPLAQGIEFNI